MPKHLQTRFLIASGARARWVGYEREHGELVTIAEFEPVFTHTQQGPKQVSFESAAPMRSGPENREAARRTSDFARQLAEEIERQVRAGEFERLGLVAPARLLKAVREQLSTTTRGKICFELQADLTKHANHELPRWLHGADLSAPADSAGR